MYGVCSMELLVKRIVDRVGVFDDKSHNVSGEVHLSSEAL